MIVFTTLLVTLLITEIVLEPPLATYTSLFGAKTIPFGVDPTVMFVIDVANAGFIHSCRGLIPEEIRSTIRKTEVYFVIDVLDFVNN